MQLRVDVAALAKLFEGYGGVECSEFVGVPGRITGQQHLPGVLRLAPESAHFAPRLYRLSRDSIGSRGLPFIKEPFSLLQVLSRSCYSIFR